MSLLGKICHEIFPLDLEKTLSCVDSEKNKQAVKNLKIAGLCTKQSSYTRNPHESMVSCYVRYWGGTFKKNTLSVGKKKEVPVKPKKKVNPKKAKPAKKKIKSKKKIKPKKVAKKTAKKPVVIKAVAKKAPVTSVNLINTKKETKMTNPIGAVCQKLFRNNNGKISQCVSKYSSQIQGLEEAGACIEGGSVLPANSGESTVDCYVRQMGPFIYDQVGGGAAPVKKNPLKNTGSTNKKPKIKFDIFGGGKKEVNGSTPKTIQLGNYELDLSKVDPSIAKSIKTQKLSNGNIKIELNGESVEINPNDPIGTVRRILKKQMGLKNRWKLSASYDLMWPEYNDQQEPNSPFKHNTISANLAYFFSPKPFQISSKAHLDLMVGANLQFRFAPEIKVGPGSNDTYAVNTVSEGSFMFAFSPEFGVGPRFQVGKGFEIMPYTSVAPFTLAASGGLNTHASEAKPDVFVKTDLKWKVGAQFVLFDNLLVGGGYLLHAFSDDVNFEGTEAFIKAKTGESVMHGGFIEIGGTW